MQKYLAILIVIVCTVLLQAHSIPFWLEHSNDYIGYLWSFTIEGVALWLWLNKKMILAIIASAIIILVPLMQLSKPLLKEMRLLNANTEIKKLNSLSISQSEKLQDKYLTTNWAGTINKNTTHLRSAIESQKDLYIDGSKFKSVYENIFIIVLQSVALMVVLLTQIQAIRMLAFRDFQTIETSNFSNSEISEIPENRAKSLLIEMQKYIKEKDISSKELADRLAIPASNLSKLKNSISGAGESLSDKKIDEIKEKFERLL